MNTFQSSPQYEHIYGSVLLDEIHNYFPALLYSQQAFTSVQDVFTYVNRQINNRFNPSVYGRSLYRDRIWGDYINTSLRVPPAPAQQPAQQASQQPAQQASQQPLEEQTFIYQFPLGASSPMSSMFQQLLREFDEPVRVAASQIQINNASQIMNYVSTLETASCIICQEEFEEGEQLRKLTHCTHYFHKACIDSWFMASVACPVCRHDIRD